MSEYVLPHALGGERQRLGLMSELLDPMERARLRQLGVAPGWRCLEVGCGNGSVSQWLAEQVAPNGCVVASDIDTSYLADLKADCLEVRRIDVLNTALEENAYDLVLARALLHHIATPKVALEKLVGALKPGGVLLSVEPDMLAATATKPEALREFWHGWLRWSETAEIDYFIGTKIAGWLDELGLEDVSGEGHTAAFNGGSRWATYWTETIRELQPKLREFISDEQFRAFFAHYEDPHYWTSVISFVATSGRKPKQL